ncbi:hypothetical protein SLITO_v1c03110 [Spiroplasma litorale]|uniref:Uncharacterized protein n=1 Tax=Spiroplasma litorale TaxID=216942 RepID=A0A0K1W1A9_9MOLU|nr:hypothetical protein [Spiroplasma litorale]AKX33966.1 hypothetical protein SLITO_v1c03110 [Spiroplasma litorale]
MHLSDLAYFSLIPIILCLVVYIIFESIEKIGHKYLPYKLKVYVIGIIVCTIIVIAIVITALFVDI